MLTALTRFQDPVLATLFQVQRDLFQPVDLAAADEEFGPEIVFADGERGSCCFNGQDYLFWKDSVEEAQLSMLAQFQGDATLIQCLRGENLVLSHIQVKKIECHTDGYYLNGLTVSYFTPGCNFCKTERLSKPAAISAGTQDPRTNPHMPFAQLVQSLKNVLYVEFP